MISLINSGGGIFRRHTCISREPGSTSLRGEMSRKEMYKFLIRRSEASTPWESSPRSTPTPRMVWCALWKSRPRTESTRDQSPSCQESYLWRNLSRKWLKGLVLRHPTSLLIKINGGFCQVGISSQVRNPIVTRHC